MIKIEPETIRKQYPDLTENQFNYIQAVLTVKNSNYCFEDWYAFENTAWGLNKQIPTFTIVEPPPVKYIWLALKRIETLRPGMEFSDEVKKYIEIVSKEQGFLFFPDIIEDMYNYMPLIKAKVNNPDSPSTLEIDVQVSKYLEIQTYIQRNLDE